MFTNIRIENFQSIVNLQVNLMKTNTKAKQMIVVYGENGVGKTNFASTFLFLTDSIRTMDYKDKMLKFLEHDKLQGENNSTYYQIIKNFFKNSDTETLIQNYKTINSKGNLVLEFTFLLKKKRGIYRIEYDNHELVSETLDYVLNNNTVNFFSITKDKQKMNDQLFKQKEYNIEFKGQLNKYWGKHSFLSILYKEKIDKTQAYINKNIHRELLNVFKFFDSISVKAKGNSTQSLTKIDQFDFISGIIPFKDKLNLEKTEKMLDNFFTHLYSDIKEVYYQKKVSTKKIEYELYVKKLIYNNIIDLKFEMESNGTKNLLSLLPYIMRAVKGDVVIVDELDYGIHDVLIQHLLNNVKDFIKGQLIITTHNTMILEKTLKKENIYIFLVNKAAEKELISLDEFGEREHKNFNLRKRYLQGIYGGIPFPVDVDFEEICNYLKED